MVVRSIRALVLPPPLLCTLPHHHHRRHGFLLLVFLTFLSLVVVSSSSKNEAAAAAAAAEVVPPPPPPPSEPLDTVDSCEAVAAEHAKEDEPLVLQQQQQQQCASSALSSSSTSTLSQITSDTSNSINSNSSNDERDASVVAVDDDDDIDDTNNMVPLDCTMVMAPSTIRHPVNTNAGWGVFRLVDTRRGQAVLEGDVVIQWSDLLQLKPIWIASLKAILQDYLWSNDETGGYYEGLHTVASVLPGIGMLANGLPPPHSNVLPFVPTVDEGGLTRLQSPGAGAITHYHNYTFFAQRDIRAGSEIFVNYGPDWFRERQDKLVLVWNSNSDNDDDDDTNNTNTNTNTNNNNTPTRRSVDWLRRNGMCLDNLQPVPRSKMIPQAGRGVVARRFLPKGSLVAPVPVLPLHREALQMTRLKKKEDDDGTTVVLQLQQLLLNYCFGHQNSSLLLYPYGPLVNLINHGGSSFSSSNNDNNDNNNKQPTATANVRLQWSQKQLHYPQGPGHFLQLSLSDLLAQGRPLLLELVALRDILPGDEILLDYGRAWSEAWQKHVEKWQPPPLANQYAPSYVHEDAIRALRTQDELQRHPYPSNIFTSCFYRYSDHNANSSTSNKQQQGKNKEKNDDAVVTVKWKQTRGIYELSNLRPCHVLQRENQHYSNSKKNKEQGTLFTVQIRNRPQLALKEVIPKGVVHIATHVPRRAIRFSDKSYTTDQHLENAFRHEIGLVAHEEDAATSSLYPDAWLDLLPTTAAATTATDTAAASSTG